MNQGACRSDSARKKRRRFIRKGHAANRIDCVADKALSRRRAMSDGVGSRRTAAGGRTRSPSEQAKSSKTMDPWDSTGLLGGNGRPLPPSLSLSLLRHRVVSGQQCRDARNLHPLRFCCWATATVFFVSRNAGAARRHALLLLRPGPAACCATCDVFPGSVSTFFLSHRVYAG